MKFALLRTSQLTEAYAYLALSLVLQRSSKTSIQGIRGQQMRSHMRYDLPRSGQLAEVPVLRALHPKLN
jgi:hypothetical protein